MDSSLEAAVSREIAALDKKEIHAACLLVAREYRRSDIEGGLFKDVGSSGSFKQLVLFCRAEVHELVCLRSTKYTRERSEFTKAATGIVGFLAGVVVAKFGVSMATATAVAMACLTLPIKITVNAWCKMYRDNQLSRHEQEVLEAG